MPIVAEISRSQRSVHPSDGKSNGVHIFRLGELFCGPGGMALGALNAGVNHDGEQYKIAHAWATDYDSDTCETYIKNICPSSSGTVICRDVRTLDCSILPEIDAFAYGFPCNDFSIVGEKKGVEGKFGPLYQYGVKALNKFKPKFFIAENVGGITSANEGNAFQRIVRELEASGNGYDLSINLYKFEEYGIPQARHRVIIVGMEKRLGRIFKVPRPTTLNHPVSCRVALEQPSIPPNANNQERTAQSKNVVERLKFIRPGENAWNAQLPPHLKLNVKGAKLSQIYKRLDPQKPAYTITGSGGGGTHVYHWEEPRALTNRERARLQTFPDNFEFCGAKESVRKQIGMAVSPKMAEIIFNAALKTMAGIEYPCVPSSLSSQSRLF
ncbi:MAG: DNA cytosine methyltransferase [Nitrospinae bacterium]|nr:DNA cytosine methyltransferase [Nitrospinota bacterium]